MGNESNSSSSLTSRLLVIVAALTVIAVVVVAVMRKKPLPTEAASIQARLELAAGDVSIDHGGAEGRGASGMPLLEGARVVTAKGARALVRLPDGSSIFMRDETAAKLGPTGVILEKGEYWLDAPPTDREPLTHAAGDTAVSAADAGLSVKLVDGTGVVYVARGMAIVNAKGGRVEVNAGEQATVAGADAPRVAPLAFWDDWTGGMADFRTVAGTLASGMGTIHAVDEGAGAGQKAQKLQVSRQSVRAVVRDGLAETEVDQTFFNPGERSVEGWYWFTVPSTASVTSFAVETNGALVEGEFIERKEAAAKYGAAKSTGHSPAILEWIDARTYRARIFPIASSGTRRVVLRYMELRPIVDDKLVYVYPMGAGDPVRIGEFSLSVDLGEAGKKMKLATLADARVEGGGSKVTMRRSGYTPRADFQIEATLPKARPPVTVSRFAAGGDSADYLMARYTPDLEWKKVSQVRGDVVVVVDTSAAGDEAAHQLKTSTAEAVLRALSDEDRFALVSLDVRPKVLHPEKDLAAAADAEISKALERLSEHNRGGATDLSALFDVALQRLHGAEQPAVVYVGDGIATSGDMTGEQLVERLRRALSSSRARLFTVGVGADADHALLSELARAGGGQSLRVDEPGEATARALDLVSQLKVPTITDLSIDLGAGLDEVFVSATGKLSRGEDVVVLARTHHDLPSKVKVKGRFAGEAFEKEHTVDRDETVVAAFVPRLWAAEYVRRLLGGAGPDEERGRIASLGIEYGLMTPFTSILALESEWAYTNMGIGRKRSPLRGVKLSGLERGLERRLAGALAAGPAPAAVLGCNAMARKSEPPPEESPASVAAAPSPVSASELDERAKEAQEPSDKNGVTQSAPASPPPPGAPEPAREEASGDDGVAAGKKGDLEDPLAGAFDSASKPSEPGGSGLRLGSGGGAVSGQGFGSGIGRLGGSHSRAAPAKVARQEGPRGSSARRDAAPEQSFRWSNVEQRTCGDAASRPLAQRVLLWRKRLRAATSAPELMDRYVAALRACELPDWRAERIFLDLLQRRIDSEAGVRLLLGQLSARPEVQKAIAKLILRRTVDPVLVAAVEAAIFGSSVDWNGVDLELQGIADVEKRLARLRELAARAPEDPNADIRLVQLLSEAGHRDEAVARGRRLRDTGLLTPRIAQRLGDVLAAAGFDAEAVRTYSEIVEFDPKNVDSRRLLGDVFLAHGWYAPAYSQYRTLTEIAPSDTLGTLRLAAAAAGAGRVDEALRLQTQVATAQGNPGPSDPRRWARLWSAARLARLLADPPPPAPGQPKVDPARRKENLERKLKELQLFSGPAALVVLTWEDLTHDLALVAQADEKDVAVGEATDASATGLYATLVSRADFDAVTFAARLRSLSTRGDVRLVRHDVLFDGKGFEVKVSPAKLPAKELAVPL